MVLFDDEHDVLDWPTSSMRWLLPSRLHFSTFVFLDHLYHLCISFSVVVGQSSADRYGRLQSWLATADNYDAIGQGGMLQKGRTTEREDADCDSETRVNETLKRPGLRFVRARLHRRHSSISVKGHHRSSMTYGARRCSARANWNRCSR